MQKILNKVNNRFYENMLFRSDIALIFCTSIVVHNRSSPYVKKTSRHTQYSCENSFTSSKIKSRMAVREFSNPNFVSDFPMLSRSLQFDIYSSAQNQNKKLILTTLSHRFHQLQNIFHFIIKCTKHKCSNGFSLAFNLNG